MEARKLFEGERTTCFSCGGRWGECTCPSHTVEELESGTLDGFDTGDFWITEPNTSECMRFYVDPEAYYGKPYTEYRDRLATGKCVPGVICR